jgi:NADPH:quinone reductase-like Zn-dependent oxidoreductase
LLRRPKVHSPWVGAHRSRYTEFAHFISLTKLRFANLSPDAGVTLLAGILFVYGALSEEPTIFPALEVTAKQPIVRGYTIWSLCSDPVRLKAAVEFVKRGLASGALKPIIAKTFPFDQIVDAHRYMEANDQFVKIVVKV